MINHCILVFIVKMMYTTLLFTEILKQLTYSLKPIFFFFLLNSKHLKIIFLRYNTVHNYYQQVKFLYRYL